MQLFNRRTAAIKVVLLASITVDPGPAECAERSAAPPGTSVLNDEGVRPTLIFFYLLASKVFA